MFVHVFIMKFGIQYKLQQFTLTHLEPRYITVRKATRAFKGSIVGVYDLFRSGMQTNEANLS